MSPIRAQRLAQASFTGMRDSFDPTAADHRKAFLLQNCYPQDPEVGGGLVGRPGFSQMGAQLGGRGQRMYQFTKLDGTTYTCAFSGGKLYTYSWGGDSWTDQSAGQPTTSSTAIIYCTTFNDKLIVSDGVNVPWTWTGAAFNALTGIAPVAYGPPVVYYGKLFFIKSTERNVIVWSEEADETIGYETTGYNNTWQLGQTDQERLFGLAATNEQLYFFRADSIGSISGAVTEDFQSEGTREGVSETVGTTSPATILYHNRAIYFLDNQMRPHFILGNTVTPIWVDMRETTRSLTKGTADAWACYYDSDDLILFSVRAESSVVNNIVLVVRPPGEFYGIWRGFTHIGIDEVLNASNDKVLVHLTSDGYAYVHGLPDGSTWTDDGTAIEHVVDGSPLGWSTDWEYLFTRCDISFRTPSTMTDIAMAYSTPNGSSAVATFTVTGGFAKWNIAVWDTDIWATTATESHKAVGLNGRGRWIRPKLTHSGSGEQFGFNAWTVDAHPVKRDPTAT